MIASRILGVGAYLPPKVWTNNDLTQFMDTSDEWIKQRTGIEERRWVGHNEKCAASDLAYEATLRALEASKTKKEEIDLIIFATLSADYYFPGSGCVLQTKLGLVGVPALDIRQQCSGFIYGMSFADAFIKSGQYKKILLVGAEVHSRALDKSTRGRDLAVLFGDGAGAVVIGPEIPGSPSKIFSTHLGLKIAGKMHTRMQMMPVQIFVNFCSLLKILRVPMVVPTQVGTGKISHNSCAENKIKKSKIPILDQLPKKLLNKIPFSEGKAIVFDGWNCSKRIDFFVFFAEVFALSQRH